MVDKDEEILDNLNHDDRLEDKGEELNSDLKIVINLVAILNQKP